MRLATFTVMHPGIMPYAQTWADSLESQRDQDFTCVVALDGVPKNAVHALFGARVPALITAPAGSSPAQVREHAWREMIPQYDAIVMIDGDDIMRGTRIEQARVQLGGGVELGACSMRTMNITGEPLEGILAAGSRGAPESYLLYANDFGLSNTVYTSPLLERLMPLPPGCALVDWYLATKAMACGARLDASSRVGVDYRQYSDNTAKICPPFTWAQVLKSSDRVSHHYTLLHRRRWSGEAAWFEDALSEASARMRRFEAFLSRANEAERQRYLESLNQNASLLLWWESVMHKQTEDLWNTRP